MAREQSVAAFPLLYPVELPGVASGEGLEPPTRGLRSIRHLRHWPISVVCARACADSILAGVQTVRIVALPLSYPDFAPGAGLEPATAVRSNRSLRHRPKWLSVHRDPLAAIAVRRIELHRQEARDHVHVGLCVLADRSCCEATAST